MSLPAGDMPAALFFHFMSECGIEPFVAAALTWLKAIKLSRQFWQYLQHNAIRQSISGFSSCKKPYKILDEYSTHFAKTWLRSKKQQLTVPGIGSKRRLSNMILLGKHNWEKRTACTSEPGSSWKPLGSHTYSAKHTLQKYQYTGVPQGAPRCQSSSEISDISCHERV